MSAINIFQQVSTRLVSAKAFVAFCKFYLGYIGTHYDGRSELNQDMVVRAKKTILKHATEAREHSISGEEIIVCLFVFCVFLNFDVQL